MRTPKFAQVREDAGMSGLWQDSETMGNGWPLMIMEDDYILSEYEARAYVEAIEVGVIED